MRGQNLVRNSHIRDNIIELFTYLSSSVQEKFCPPSKVVKVINMCIEKHSIGDTYMPRFRFST
jgi:hypothetical protein